MGNIYTCRDEVRARVHLGKVPDSNVVYQLSFYRFGVGDNQEI